MTRLHGGQPRTAALAGAVIAFALGLGALAAGPAMAETVGGELLASTRRTAILQPDAHDLPKVWAETWLLADATTGEVLAQKGSHVRRAPASTLKMLTALTVMPQTPPETTYVATAAAANTYGARVGLKPGRTYTLDQLWYAVFLPSANDAAIAVAQANGGVKRTVAQMNGVARDLGALDTVAKTPNGLDAPGQLSSAYDLALIARAGMKLPEFAHYAGTTRAEFPDVKGKGSHPIYTTNRLLLHGWKGMIGVKTGFTSRAGRTYVGAATRNGRTLLVTLMGIHESSEAAARKLLTWGFANADSVTPIGTLVEPGSVAPSPDAVAGPDAGADAGTNTAQAGLPAGTATTAASPGDEPASMPGGVLIAAAVLSALTVGTVVIARRRSAHRGRHAA
ncbi:MAG: D-alanyl-D-alanine carboxypeptidase [Actinobacteria bacterium]|nr:D-alanyl-D-alanine carboxypeptidase [Actinomycetota bacterium]